MNDGWRTAFAEFGGLRTRFAWRFFGWVALELAVLVVAVENHGPSGRPPWTVFALGAGGLALVVLGPSIALLAATSAVGATLLLAIARGDPAYQLAEEYLPLAVLPALGALLAAWALLRPGRGAGDARSREIDAAQLSMFRLAVLLMMAFAALHKVNADFFDPAVSCATVHAARFLRIIPGAASLAGLVPVAAVAAELAVPLLLLFAPRVGLPVVVLAMLYIGHRGATPFTQLVMMLSCTFLREADLRAVLGAVRRRWGVVALGLAALTLVAAFVFDRDQWPRYYPYALATASLGFGAGSLALSRLVTWLRAVRSGRLARELRADIGWTPLLPRERGARLALLAFALAGVANASTPYLGGKFRLSFAMFSNLRVDDARWNSLWVPRSVYLPEHDGYLHVADLDGSRSEGAGVDGLYSRAGLGSLLEARGRAGKRLAVRVRHGDDERSFANATRSSELREWLAVLPRGRWNHDYLPASGPQRCVH